MDPVSLYLQVFILIAIPFCNGNSYHITVHRLPDFLTSDRYPSNYYRNENHNWYLVTSNADDVIRLVVADSDIEYSLTCSYDYVQIYDGYDSSSKLLRKFCGLTEPEFTSSSQYMYIRFHTDATIERRGFNMTYWSTSQNKSNDIVDISLIAVVSSVCGVIFIIIITFIICHCAKAKNRERDRRITPSMRAQGGCWNYTPRGRLPTHYNTPRTTRLETIDACVYYTNPGEALPDYGDLYPISPPPPYSEEIAPL